MGVSMSKKKKKKNSNNNNNFNFPFNNEICSAKHHLKKMIDDMPDDVFIDFCMFIDSFFNMDEDWIEEQWEIDEGWEDEAEAFYNHYNNSDENLTLFDEDSLPF